MNLCCTKSLLLILGKEYEVNCDRIDSTINVWYALQINIRRKKYLMITNSILLYTIFIPFGSKNDRKLLLDNFRKELFYRLSDDFGEDLAYLAFKKMKVNTFPYFTRTNSRRVLGSMNDFKQMINYTKEHYKNELLDPCQMSKISNESPMSYLEMRSGKSSMELFLKTD